MRSPGVSENNYFLLCRIVKYYIHGELSVCPTVSVSWSLSSSFSLRSKSPWWWSHLPPCPPPGLRPVCLLCLALFEAPTAHTTFFVSVIGQPDSARSTTGQRVQIPWPRALGHFTLRPTGVGDVLWMLLWQFAHSAGVLSRWCFFKNDFTFCFFHHVAKQSAVCSPWFTSFRLKITEVFKDTACASTSWSTSWFSFCFSFMVVCVLSSLDQSCVLFHVRDRTSRFQPVASANSQFVIQTSCSFFWSLIVMLSHTWLHHRAPQTTTSA